MREMILCVLVILGFLNSGMSQSNITSQRILVKAYDSDGMVEKIHLKGNEALEFDIPQYIKENNQFDRIVINGSIRNNLSTTTIKFDSNSEINEIGDNVCKEVESKLTPFLGIYGTSKSSSQFVDIISIIPNSSAEVAGLTAEENIVGFDGVAIHDFPELQKEVLASKIGSNVILEIENGTNKYSKSVIVGSRGLNTITYKYCEDKPLEIPDDLSLKGIEEIYLNTYPNPTNALSHVNFRSNSDDNVIFTVTDVTGSLIHKEEYSNFNGSLRLDYNLVDRSDGTYIFSIQQGKEIYNRKVQLSK